MRELSLLVEAEVGRADHDDRVRSDLGGVDGQRHGLGSRLGAAVDGHEQPPVGGLEEEVRRPPSFLAREQDPLARGAERHDPVETRGDEEVDERPERVVVELAACVPKRRHGCGQGAAERCHQRAVSPLLTRSSVPAMRRARVSGALRLLDPLDVLALERHGEALRGHRPNHMFPAMGALRVERDGEVLRVTLARPERRNAFDAALIAELTEAFADVGDARAVVLSGEGPSFCAGADVEWQRVSIELDFDENVEDAMRLYRMLETIDSCPAPVVCAVHGYALGGGSGLVACADIGIAQPDAVFGFTEVRLGIIPAVISPFVLARIGAARAALLRDRRALRRETPPSASASSPRLSRTR